MDVERAAKDVGLSIRQAAVNFYHTTGNIGNGILFRMAQAASLIPEDVAFALAAVDGPAPAFDIAGFAASRVGMLGRAFVGRATAGRAAAVATNIGDDVARLERGEGGAWLMGRHESSMRITPALRGGATNADGQLIVHVHGDRAGRFLRYDAKGGEQYLADSEIVAAVKAHPAYNPKAGVELRACYSGCTPEGGGVPAGARLATALDAPVKAPNGAFAPGTGAVVDPSYVGPTLKALPSDKAWTNF